MRARRFSSPLILVISAVLAGLLPAPGLALDVRVEHDEEFDFEQVKTFGWMPDEKLPGRARIEGNAEIIREEIATALTQKGLRFQTAPDVLVIYYVGLQDQVSITRDESGSTHATPYEEGTLILEFYALGRDRPIWRGEAEDPLESEKVRKQVRKVLTRMLKDFPPPDRDSHGLVVDGVDEMRRAIREEVRNGSDWIKLLVSGAFMSAGDNPQQVHFSPEELRTAMEEAGRLGVPVMAHAHSAEAIKQAVRAGVRSIEHGTCLDDEGIELMKEHGTYLIPTFYIGEYFLEEHADSAAQSKMVELTRRYRALHLDAIGKAIRAGVKIGVGTDYVGFPPSQGVRELSMLVQAGMTPDQAIQAATRVNAELLGWEDRIGTVEAGKLADLIVVDGSPLEDLTALERVSLVMIGGQTVSCVMPDSSSCAR